MLWWKIIQFGDGKLEIPLVKIPNSPLCPYQAYTNMCKLVPNEKSCLPWSEKLITYPQSQIPGKFCRHHYASPHETESIFKRQQGTC
jgi:hypothetical protein